MAHLDDEGLPLRESEEDDDDMEDEDNNDDDDDEKGLIRQRAYRKFLLDLKLYVQNQYGAERPNILADKEEKPCALCPTQWFKGWKALMAHAQTFKKKKIQQHRGYHQALREALRVDERPQDDQPAAGTRAVSVNPNTDFIVWPPILLLRTLDDSGASLCSRASTVLQKNFEHMQDMTCLPVSPTCLLVTFRAEAIGYLEASMVAKWFADKRQGRDQYLSCHSRHLKYRDEADQPLMFAYLANVEDMLAVDGKKRWVEWSIESHSKKVPMAQRKFKEEHDTEQAKIKDIALQLENLAEDEIKLKTNKKHIEQLIREKHHEVECHKQRAEEMEQRFAKQMLKMDEDFQRDMKYFAAVSIAKEKRKRQELYEFEKRLELEQIARKEEIESLQKQFHKVTEDLKQKETQKAFQRELDVMQKKEKFMEDMAKAEAMFNQQAREQESSLQEKQHRERMQLLEEAKKEREQLLKEWLEKQETLKKEGEEAKQAKDQLEKEAREQAPECAVCWDRLTEDNRALLKPCGHATLCLECAVDVYKEEKGCPLCRQVIKEKPIKFPKKLFM